LTLSSPCVAEPAVREAGQDAAAARSVSRPKPRVFTDTDLERYREERLRAERASASPPPQARETQVGPAAARVPERKPQIVDIQLLDLNRTLPAGDRRAAEQTGRRFVEFFGVPLDAPLVVPLRYFPDPAEYREHMKRNYDDDVLWAGYYDPRSREIVVGSGERYRTTLVHELTHFVVGTVFEDAPSWLHEGLAEYFETAASDGGTLVVADDLEQRRRLGAWLRGTRQPDARQLLALNSWSFHDEDVKGGATIRALAWSVVAFLMSSPEGRQTLADYMLALKDQGGLNSLSAFDRCYRGGAAAFERDWLAYVERVAASR
jgi:hypothetical protein